MLNVARRWNWKGCPLWTSTISTFTESATFHVVVESPRGSRVWPKNEARWLTMSISRRLARGLRYLYDGGFVPSTIRPDGRETRRSTRRPTMWYAGILRVEPTQVGTNGSHRIRSDRLMAVLLALRCESPIALVNDLPSCARDEPRTPHDHHDSARRRKPDIPRLGRPRRGAGIARAFLQQARVAHAVLRPRV
jgi:hypothetical protein